VGYPAASSDVGSSNVGASVASGAAQGFRYGGPYGAAAGAVVGLITPYLNDDLQGGGGSGKMGSNLFGLSQQNQQRVTTIVSSPVDTLFTPSVNVNLGSVGGISPTSTGGLTSTNSPNIQPDQTISPSSNPLAGLYGQPAGGTLAFPYGYGGSGAPGISGTLTPNMILIIGGLILLLVMAGKSKHHR